jgi:cytochrome c551/c552
LSFAVHRIHLAIVASLTLLATWCYAAEPLQPVAADAYTKQIAPIVKAHCLACHGGDAQEGGVSYAEITDDQHALRRRPLWKRALARVKAGEMPPDGETPLSDDEKRKLTDWLGFASEYLDCSDAARDPGPTVLRRLNRTEFDAVVRDLVGLEFRSAEAVGMPEEAVVDGFDNTAAALGFSPTLMEKHLAAADKIIERLAQPQQAKQREQLLFVRPSNQVGEEAAAEQIVQRLVRRAYRGAVSDDDVEPLVTIFQQARKRGADFDAAALAMLKPVLVSPRGQPAAEGAFATRVTDHELAVRLSFYLWSSMPDEELSRLADSGELSRPAVLRVQTLRMLKDPKGRALVDNFAVQWLQLGKLAHARPSTEFFPTFNHQLRESMRQETLLFLDYLRLEDRSVLELLEADYTFVNPELAKHYGLAQNEPKFVRVSLRPEDHRGGLLGMGSVLAMTSHTFRTSPTQRGKYILDVLLGSPVPPPPANAGMLKDDDQNKRRAPATFREQLAQHATQKACAGCHKKLDPLGFALDNYDAIGSWRESRPELPLDVVGELPGGERFEGVAQLKQLLLKRKDEFTRGLTAKLLVYALGRELDYFDDCTIYEVADRLNKNEYRFSELILGIVESYPFQHRRVDQ